MTAEDGDWDLGMLGVLRGNHLSDDLIRPV